MRFRKTVLALTLLCAAIWAGAALSQQNATTPTTVDSALETARTIRAKIGDKAGVRDYLLAPATSDTIRMRTLGTGQEFDGRVTCPGSSPIVRVTAYPEDSYTGSGELRVVVEYDLNLDGSMDQALDIRHMGGVCGDGFISGCSPAGSWKNCAYSKWTTSNGQPLAVSVDPATHRDITVTDLHGCFCFNRSCGNPVLGVREQIMSFVATGVLERIRSIKGAAAVVITEVRNDPENLRLEYVGASASKCGTNTASVYQAATVNDLVSLQDRYDFGGASAAAAAPTNSTYKILERSYQDQDTGTVIRQCNITASVGTRQAVRTRDPKLACPKKATEPVTYSRSAGEDGTDTLGNEIVQIVFAHQANPGTDWDFDVIAQCGDGALNVAHAQCRSNGGDCPRLSQAELIAKMRGYGYDFPAYKYECAGAGGSACLGGDDFCRCSITDDVFTCKSSGMGKGDGSTLYNRKAGDVSGETYDWRLYQGCDEVTDPTDGCKVYATDADCALIEEVTDGVTTVRGGASTGLTPFTSCKLIQGAVRSITVCEPWWQKTRSYRCKNKYDFNFDQAKARTEYVGSHIGYDDNSGAWTSQGDLRFNADGSSYQVVFDPKLQFQTANATCEPACLVSTPGAKTDVFVQGLTTTTTDQAKRLVETRPCTLKSNGQYACAVNSARGETVETACTCFDASTFAEAATQMSVIRGMTQDTICSSGTKAGVCEPEAGQTSKKYVCGRLSASASGEVEVGGMWDCDPKAWMSTGIPAQTHQITATTDYRCRAAAAGVSESVGAVDTDHFDNDLGALSPVSGWFDACVTWAKARITELIAADPAYHPAVPSACACAGGTNPGDGHGGHYDCAWKPSSTAADINRQDDLGLRPSSSDPFGDAYLFFSQRGSWGGTHYGGCGLSGGECQDIYRCPANGTLYPSPTACSGNCVQAGACAPQPSGGFSCTAGGGDFSSLSACSDACRQSYPCTQQGGQTTTVTDAGIGAVASCRAYGTCNIEHPTLTVNDTVSGYISSCPDSGSCTAEQIPGGFHCSGNNVTYSTESACTANCVNPYGGLSCSAGLDLESYTYIGTAYCNGSPIGFGACYNVANQSWGDANICDRVLPEVRNCYASNGLSCSGPGGTCSAVTTTGYRCSSNSAVYSTQTACQSACTSSSSASIYATLTRAACPDGYAETGSTASGTYQVGSCAGSSAQTTYSRTCQATQYRCAVNGAAYTDAASCSQNCYANESRPNLYQSRQAASCPTGTVETGQTAVGTIQTSSGATTATACTSYTAQTVYEHACQAPTAYQCGKDGTVYGDLASCQTQCWQNVRQFDTLAACQAGCTQSGWFCESVNTGWDMQTVTDIGANAKLTMDANSCAVATQCQVTTKSCPAGYTEISDLVVGQAQCCGEATEGAFNCPCTPTNLHQRTCIRYTSRYVCRSDGTTCTPDQKPTCRINGQAYTDTATCTANCGQSLTCDTYSKCNGPTAPSGQVFFTPTECAMFCKSYACSINNKSYDQFSLDECQTGCRENVTCNEQVQDHRYKTTIRNTGSNDYQCVLDRTLPSARHVGETAYADEALILRQCVDRYDQAFLNFTDPASGATFKYSKADLLLYQAAASAGRLPRSASTFVLPDSPPLYTADNPQVPLTPQFPGKTWTTSWSDDDSTRLGTHSVTFANLKPLAYYWQCPQGSFVAGSSTALCSAEPEPFGGIESTVKGAYCFQYKCGEADISPVDTTYSGCGYVNDGQWSTP